ncbi:MAG: MBOAT family O-acyltransferase [Acidobacteriota bacterium]
MLFQTLTFAGFFAVVWLVSWGLLARRLRLLHVFLLLASYGFYMAWDAKFVLLILFSTLVDWVVGGLLHRKTCPVVRKRLLLVSLACNLGLLGVFKYYNFFLDNLNAALEQLGLGPLQAHHELLLPVGISFYTFQSLSYTIDIYRRRLEPAPTVTRFALFVAFFPQLVAGPIVRARQFLPQLETPREVDGSDMVIGLFRFLVGLVKKVVFADTLGRQVVDRVFENPTHATSWVALCGAWATVLQIYFDFSGYSDMAIGTARMLGFKLPENFNAPFRATNLAEAWQRWHRTLTDWIRDYVHLPLIRWARGRSWLPPSLITLLAMSLFGFWHGASWTFVLFGLVHGIGLVLTGAVLQRGLRRSRHEATSSPALPLRWLRTWLSRLLLFQFMGVTALLFRAPDLATATDVFSRLLGLSPFSPVNAAPIELPGTLWIGLVTVFLPEWLRGACERRLVALPDSLLGLLALLTLGLVGLHATEARPFVYFAF